MRPLLHKMGIITYLEGERIERVSGAREVYTRVILSSGFFTIYQPAAHPCFISQIIGSNEPISSLCSSLFVMLLCSDNWTQVSLNLPIYLTLIKPLFCLSVPFRAPQSACLHYLLSLVLWYVRQKALGAIRMATGWIESIWIGFRLLLPESLGWYDVQTTGMSCVGLLFGLLQREQQLI